MVAVVPNLLSDQPPDAPLRAGLGDRFHYFRGASGRRYLFSAIAAGDLADFRSAVVMLARRSANGQLAATDILVLDRFGRVAGGRGRPATIDGAALPLVHLMAESEAERLAVVSDLTAAAFTALPMAA